jgi:hypothetical protein
MKRPVSGQEMSDEQQKFVDAAEGLGARSPAAAQPLGVLPRITARAIDELLDAGIVREAAPGTYYVYQRSRRAIVAPEGVVLSTASSFGWRRFAGTLALWLLVILAPLIMIKLAR